MTSQPDNALWEAFCRQDKQAFAEIFNRYYSPLYRYGSKLTGNRELLEDAIQELFVELWVQNKHENILSINAYLMRALKYKLIRSMKGRRMVEAGEHNGFFELSHDNFIVENETNAERAKKISTAIQQLPPRQREIVYLKFFHGLSYDEVEHIMDINYQVARNLLCQAIKSLKKILAYSGMLITVCCI